MDIEDITKVVIARSAKISSAGKESDSKEFGAVLKEVSEKTSGRPAQSVAEIKEPLDMRNDLCTMAVRRAICDRLGRFLDTLELYQKQLEDPFVKLREIGPTVERVDAERDELMNMARILPDKDELRDIYSEVVIRAALEVERFQRGDYV